MFKEKRHLSALWVKLGLAVALSFVGYLYSRRRARNTKPYLPPPPSSSHRVLDRCNEIDSGGNDGHKDDVQASKMAPTSDPEEISLQQSSFDDASVGLSPSIKHDGDVFLLQEFNDLIEEFDHTASAGPSPKKELETPRSDRTFRSAEKDDQEKEIKHLRNMVRVLRERERNLEVQLLEYYGLKEQETTVMELQNRLKINNMEAKLFNLKIESLQSENQRLEAQVADHAKVVTELETGRSRIKLLKKKLKLETEQNREQIQNLQKRVARLQEEELKASANKQDTESKLQRLKVLEGEVEELRKSNKLLQIENSELAQRLESTQMLANSVLEDPEREALNEMRNCLRQENEELTKRIEQLQADRCADAEELVYLRWINACLRYELRNYEPNHIKTIAKDLSKSLSPRSSEKAKTLILQYARTEGTEDRGMNSFDFDCDQWSSSQASYSTEEVDDSSFENSTTTKTTNSRKIKFFKNLRRLIQGKHSQQHRSQASPASKTDNLDDIDSPTWSSGRENYDSITMPQSHSERFTTPSQSSSRTSFDVPRWRSSNLDHIIAVEKFRRNSDCSSYGYKTFIFGREDASSDSPVESQLDQDPDSLKSDLVKFAQALSEAGTQSAKTHKKSASFV